MLKVVVLGTSGSTPTKSRSMPSVAIIREGDVYLFDCGEGTQMRMMQNNINISKIKSIFISHTHGDHVIGIAGLVRTLALNNREEPLFIYVPAGFEKVIGNLITFDKAIIKYPIIIKGVSSGKVYVDKEIEVRAFPLNHTIKCYGYSFSERRKRRFIKEKCDALGIKGRDYSILSKRGFIIKNGKRIGIREVTYIQEGRKIVYATDTRPCATTVRASRNADLLIHEATFTEKEKGLARERKHSTAKEAAIVAMKAHAKLLVLTHLSARYRNTLPIKKEAGKLFENVVVARDGYSFEIERKE
ncbi:MAG: ribonuclease Z [Candidatus Micrarchaeia archaeon]|jgi:ribonuclease Z